MKYEGPNSYQSNDMANVKVFTDKQTDKHTDGQTDKPKTICHVVSMRGHNKNPTGNAVPINGIRSIDNQSVKNAGVAFVNGANERNEFF